MDTEDDPVVAILPVHFTTALASDLHLLQFPLLYRSLRVPPSAAESGKRIRARYKPRARRLEVQVPVDVRKEVWNPDKGLEYGRARAEEDVEQNISEKKKSKEPEKEHRLNDVTLRGEKIVQKGDYILGMVRDGHLHLHPISQTHQLRPSLTYLDVLSKQSKRTQASGGDESDSEEGPPPDSVEPVASTSTAKSKKEKQSSDSKEVQVTAKKSTEDRTGSLQFQGGLSQVRREMLTMIRDEAEEQWVDLQHCDAEVESSLDLLESLPGRSDASLLWSNTVHDLLNL